MSLRRVFVPLLASFAVAFSACEGCEDPPGEGEGEGEDDAVAICEIWTRGSFVFTQQILSSLAAPARCAARDLGPVDPGQFAAAAAEACANGGAAEFQQGVDGGRVRFNRENIEACAALDINTQTTLPAVCEAASLFTPLVGENGACEQGWDCQDGLACEAPSLTDDAHRCLRPAQAGAACLAGVRTCAPELKCVDARCVAKSGANGPCQSSSDCLADLRCGTDGRCAPLAQAGEECAADGDCADDLVCFDDLFSADQECADVSECPAGAVCDDFGFCARPRCTAPIPDGQACTLGGAPCEASCSTCRPTTPRGATLQCQDRGEAGAACNEDDDCHAGFLCDAASGACVVGGGQGAPCGSSEDCRAGFGCGTQGTCTPRGGIGDACDASAGCAEGFCVSGFCSAGANGDNCAADRDCSGELLCVSGRCGAPPTTGVCSVGGACASGFFCNAANACAPLPGDGQACAPQNRCAAGFFCNADGSCAALKPTGAACASRDECENGNCVDGQCSTFGMSCTTDKGSFQFFVMLALVLPLRRRLLRKI
jgi:hypothetical protein